MDFEGLAELLVPLAFLGIVGALIALRMLKPYGNRILELVREIQEERHQALAETREMQQLRDRIDTLAERQDFLETLVEHRLDEGEQARLERIRREQMRSGVAHGGTAGARGSGGRDPGNRTGGDGPDGEDAGAPGEEDASGGTHGPGRGSPS